MSIPIHFTGQTLQTPAAPAPQRAVAPERQPDPLAAALSKPVKATDAAQQRKELQEALERLNDQMRKQGRNLSFSMDEKVNRTVIQVKDTSTGELVRQIPDETVLKVSHSIEDLKGLLLNKST